MCFASKHVPASLQRTQRVMPIAINTVQRSAPPKPLRHVPPHHTRSAPPAESPTKPPQHLVAHEISQRSRSDPAQAASSRFSISHDDFADQNLRLAQYGSE